MAKLKTLIEPIDLLRPGHQVRPQRRGIQLRLQKCFGHTNIIREKRVSWEMNVPVQDKPVVGSSDIWGSLRRTQVYWPGTLSTVNVPPTTAIMVLYKARP